MRCALCFTRYPVEIEPSLNGKQVVHSDAKRGVSSCRYVYKDLKGGRYGVISFLGIGARDTLQRRSKECFRFLVFLPASSINLHGPKPIEPKRHP